MGSRTPPATGSPASCLQDAYGPEFVNVVDQQHDPDSLLNFIRALAQRYRDCPELGWGTLEILDQPYAAVLAHRCTWDDGSIVLLHNLAADAVTVPLALSNWIEGTRLSDLLGPATLEPDARGRLEVRPRGYGYRWIRVIAPDSRRRPELRPPARGSLQALPVGGDRLRHPGHEVLDHAQLGHGEPGHDRLRPRSEGPKEFGRELQPRSLPVQPGLTAVPLVRGPNDMPGRGQAIDRSGHRPGGQRQGPAQRARCRRRPLPLGIHDQHQGLEVGRVHGMSLGEDVDQPAALRAVAA